MNFWKQLEEFAPWTWGVGGTAVPPSYSHWQPRQIIPVVLKKNKLYTSAQIPGTCILFKYIPCFHIKSQDMREQNNRKCGFYSSTNRECDRDVEGSGVREDGLHKHK